MNDPKIEPKSVPLQWHNFLYCSVLLPWETELKFRKKFPRFDCRNPLFDISLIRFNHTGEVKQAWEGQRSNRQKYGSLTFHSNNGAALKDLLKLLRNCSAHGHYAKHSKNGWIFFKHEYQGKLTLFGQVRFSNLKKLIEHIVKHHD
ncbi:hypothetical protein [Gallionella capsiferriformans]|uniref:pEK499-p136 HEPN domain-containing protein n=1 Tax=Gallionella capsiferriformans (strain ES-2) TaxID=395494 RepID=D9SK94_GALCS|nr:hypothetical protein [Gallionella capsiferriformans]ADL56506.1 hypothetical protein Galf_2507 [Gallionella capsiferriformans ES-2]